MDEKLGEGVLPFYQCLTGPLTNMLEEIRTFCYNSHLVIPQIIFHYIKKMELHSVGFPLKLIMTNTW